MSGVADDTLEHWKNKCKELETLVKALSTHCYKVVEKHEELTVKYKANESQYEAVVARLKDTEEKLAKMGTLIQPACTEYSKMKSQLELEVGCRHHAEQYASKVTRQNKELKRQSQMMLDSITSKGLGVTGEINFEDIPPPADPEDAEALPNGKDPQQEYIEALDEKLKCLEESNATLLTELEAVRRDLEIETEKKSSYSSQNKRLKEEVQQVNESLKQHQDALKRLASASESAFQEYEQLKGSYEKEILCRDEAEQYAAKLFAEKEAAKRQSNVLLMKVAGDDKLMKDMLDLETLTTKTEQEKAQFERQIKELEQEIQTLREREAVDSLEKDNQRLTEEKDDLRHQLTSLRDQVKAAQAQYDQLLKHYKDLENELEEAKRPKPPPPPPPPPPPAPKIINIFSRGKKKKELLAKAQKGGATVSPDYSKALEEMMQRIKDGKPLKRTLKTRRPSCPEESESDKSAMSELRGLLSNMKKSSSEGDLLSATSGDHDNTELAQMFRKIRKNSNPDEDKEWSEQNVVLRNQSRPPPKVAGRQGKPLSRVSEGDETFKD